MTTTAPIMRTELLADFDALLARQFEALAAPGVWFTGAEQIEIAAQSRRAIAGQPAGHDDLDPTVREVTRRIAAEASTIRPEQIERWQGHGVTGEMYVEILSIVARLSALDTAAYGLGLDQPVLPTPTSGEPSNETVDEAEPNKGWVPTVGEAHPLTALTAVPGAHDLQFDIHNTLYLSIEMMGDTQATRDGVHRTQIELAAARTSYLNECFF